MTCNPRLLDVRTKAVHQLTTGTKYLLSSHSHLFPPSLETQASSIAPSLPLLLPPPVTHNEQYCLQIEIGNDGEGQVTVWVGEVTIDKKMLPIRGSPVSLHHDAQLELGDDLVLQYLTEELPRRRLLPPTPGPQLSPAPPPKPTRSQPQQPLMEKSETDGVSHTTSLEESLDQGLRERLKRIAREVNSRESGAGRSKPPPPYEQVGNSIGYQLLLQRQAGGQKDGVSTTMIDTLYPMLKYMQLKEPSLEQFYTEYLQQYSAARRAGATPTNMHPEDTPTLVFIVDTLIQLCSLPRVNELAVRYCPVWMSLLSVFCHSARNQLAIATKRLATKVVSCMGLGIMSDQADFQAHGWSILTHVVATPTPRGSKPALPEPAIALAMPLVERQLQQYGGQFRLATAVLGFLARLALTAKQRVNREQSVVEEEEEEKEEEVEEEVYSVDQAKRVLELLTSHNVLRHVMKVPPQVRRDPIFDSHYCLLVKTLVPTRRKIATKPPSLPPSAHSTSSLATPPAKPKRIRRATTDTNLIGSRKSRKSRKSYKTKENAAEESVTAGEMSRSLSEEKLTECVKEEEEEEEEGVVRSEGEEGDDEDEEEEEEAQANRRLQEMKQLKKKRERSQERMSKEHMNLGTPDKLKNEKDQKLESVKEEVKTKEKKEEKQKSEVVKQDKTNKENEEEEEEEEEKEEEEMEEEKKEEEEKEREEKVKPKLPVDGIRKVSPKHIPTSPPPPTGTVSPPPHSPLSPDSLAGDIASVLAEVREPVRQYSLKRNPGQPAVRVPNLPVGHNSYYRTSMKRKSLKLSATTENGPKTGGARQSWAPVSPPVLPVDHTHPLETSLELHTSEVECGHEDVCMALSERLEVMSGVSRLWRDGRGLQAATNCVHGCFSDDVYDTALYCDLMTCFTAFQSPWTLGVAVVLLPVTVQLLHSIREPSQLIILINMLELIVNRFSPSILACKRGNKSRKISATSDLQQRTTCYTELHKAWVATGDRLECKDGNRFAGDNAKTISQLSKLRHTLSSFSTQLPS